MENYDGAIKKEEMAGKYVFWDIDGTLAPFRFNGHIGDPLGTHHGMSLTEIEEGCFYYRVPSKHMQKVVKTCNAKKQFILGHCHSPKEISDKHKWVPENFPEISELFLVEDEVPKYTVVLKYCEENGIDPKETVLIDDKIPLLIEAERHGINAYHISSFLDWD